MGSRPDLRDLAGRRVFITGAASGIGRATALLAGARGAELFLTDRDADGLSETAADIGSTVAYAHPADIADHASVQAMAADIHAAAGPMDVVMNIAGVAAWGTVRELTHRQWRAMVEVDLMGPVHVIETFVPPMIEAGRGGHLVNVASAAALLGLPWHAAYSAAKFGLRGVSEVLRFELRPYGIGVSLVCPGRVATPLTDTVEIAGVDQEGAAFRRLQARYRSKAVPPERAARAILAGVRRNRYLVFTSPDIRAIHWIERVCPPVYVAAMRVADRRANRMLDAAR